MKKEQTKEEYKEWLEETANKNRNNPNHSEQAFIDILDYFDIKYTFEKPVIYDSKDGYIFDFYMIIDDNEYDIEIDGKSHMDELTKLKDFKRDVQAKEHNIKVIRLDSYFVLYLRNVFKEEFTKESFLEWIINECPINLKKDMSEYKEKYENIKIELDTILEYAVKKTMQATVEMMKQAIEELKLENKKLEQEKVCAVASKIFYKYKAEKARQNKTSKVETSNNDPDMPF